MKRKILSLRLEPADLALITKAAKLEKRSANSYIIVSMVATAKSRIDLEKKRPSSVSPQEATA